MKKRLNMTEKQIIDRLDSINLSLRQKKDLIDVIKDITASSGGNGGTSTDKEALDIYLDNNTMTIIIDDKAYIPEIEGSTCTITNKELHDRLYNFLINTYRPVYLKSAPTNDNYIFGICTGGIVDKEVVNLLFLAGADIIAISINNQ